MKLESGETTIQTFWSKLKLGHRHHHSPLSSYYDVKHQQQPTIGRAKGLQLDIGA